jgi:hypothetical protein
MKIEQKLKKIISKINLRDHKKTDSATVHYYIQITSRYGVKLFRRQRSCEECFFRQSAAYAMGFGPKALFTGIKNGYSYYVTEHAQRGVSRRDISKIRSNVNKMGWSTFDLYSDNVGIVRGKPVLIDFDNYTLT